MADSLTSVVASIPPGANPFAYLRGVAYRQVAPQVNDAIFPVLYTFIGIYAVVAITTAIGFFLRWQKGQLWFWKRAAMPTGTLVVPHPVNLFAAWCLVYMLVSQGLLAGYVVSLHGVQHGAIRQYYRTYIGQLTFIPLFAAACGDMAGSVTGVLTSRFRTDKTVPRWLPAWAVHLYVFGLPIMFAVGLAAMFTVIGVRSTSLANAYDALDGALAAFEPTWTGGLPLLQLLQVEPLALDLESQAHLMIVAFKALYGFIAACLILLFIVWAPANAFQISALLNQIHHLRQTAQHEQRVSQEEASMARQSHIGSRMSFNVSNRRSKSSLERQSRRLMSQCWTRICAATGMTLVVVVYTFIAVWICSDPEKAVSSEGRSIFFIVSTFACFIAVAVPVLIIFFLRSFDSSALKTNTTSQTSRGSMSLGTKDGGKHSIGRLSKDDTRPFSSNAKGQLVSFADREKSESVVAPLAITVDIERATRIDVLDDEEQKEEKV